MGVRKFQSCHHDCLCKLLKEFEGEEVTIRTKSEDVIEGELITVTMNCCVKIVEPELYSPYIGERLTIIRCKDIEHFSVSLLTN
ncbi:hypothetical protein [Bacillus suaedaesalsae]|uniref:Uncharacterized protein n=1 Tax=Bacillus suaedaesalsae TaxID=2810349 RepID=A0ABS2DIK2_9BACI|nr:hypothetical protein [Bacillus suaedaesalsae]MBM6618237.1 hypothetical protein [Bacillus suaedaesalsae]